ncbi:hypothetical protein ABBQ38_014500 [Trebouxia sp. C0009 RCD-2024]
MQADQPSEVALLQRELEQQQQWHPQQQQQQQQQMATASSRGPFDPSSCTSVYVGNLHPYVTEPLLHATFSAAGPISQVKIKKDKATGMSAGFGFVEYEDHRSAARALQTLNGQHLWNQQVRVNWAYQKDQREDTSGHCHIFVGDLSSEVTHEGLFAAFQHCGDCSDANVIWDRTTGRSKGYGFVSFRTQDAAEQGIAMMNGKLVGSRRIRCGWAQHKQAANSLDYTTVHSANPHNCNVYVGNVSPDVSDADLRHHFGPYGDITDVKIYRKGGYGFVNYLDHSEAVHAIVAMNGHIIGNKAINCAWGRHQPHQPQPHAIHMLHMQPQIHSPMQSHSQLGYVGGQGMLALMRPMIQMPAGIQMPNQLPNLGVPQLGSPQLAQHGQHAQQALLQQALLSSGLPVGGQLGTQHASQQHMMASHRAQLDPNSILYCGMYGSMYGAP